MRTIKHKLLFALLPVLLLNSLLAESAVFHGSRYQTALGKGSALFQVKSPDNKYRIKVFGHRVELWNEKKQFFIKALATEFPIRDIAYQKNRVFVFFQKASPIGWNILSDELESLDYIESQSKKLKKGSSVLKESGKKYLLISENSFLRRSKSGVVFLEKSQKAGLAIYSNSKAPSKLRQSSWKLKQGVLSKGRVSITLPSFLSAKQKVQSVWARGLKTENDFIRFFPSLDAWANRLENLKKALPKNLETLKLLAGFYPQSAPVLLALVEEEIKDKNYSAALDKLKKINAPSSLKNEIHLKTGKIYFLQRKYNLAKKELRRVKNAEGYFYLGTIYLIQRKYKSARWYLNRALKTDPSYSKAYNNLSVVYQKQRNFRRAERILLDGISKNPKDPKLYYNLGLLQEKLKKEGLALLAFEKAYQLEEAHTGTINRLYYLYMKWDMVSDALNLLKRTLKANPEDSVSHYNIALLYLQQKQRALAVFHFNAFLSFSKDERLKKRVNYRLKQILKNY